MVNKPLIRPYFLGGGSFGGVARIPMMFWFKHPIPISWAINHFDEVVG